MKYETVVGIEVHVELKTKSKRFSPSPNAFGDEPNTNVNPKDLGFPGTLPRLNEAVVNYGMKVAMPLNCDIASETIFDRKHYFYPDSPAAYQISTDKQRISENGLIYIKVDGEQRRIVIERIHLEEDAGKLTHSSEGSLVDYNRQGTPLIEIVSEADI